MRQLTALLRQQWTILRTQKAAKSLYSHTLLLPTTSFPARLEGQKRVTRDQEITESTTFQALYTKQRQRETKDKDWVLHDGPPYANGETHLGHAVNKVLKDVTNRWKVVKGQRVHYRPGWDCHGLPIELKVLQDAKAEGKLDLTPIEIRERARKVASGAISGQKSEFMSWGVLGDWENPYLTMSTEFVKREIRLFFKMVQKGKMFRRHMPVYWSPSSLTALAESELEYDPKHVSTAAYVSFPVVNSKKLGPDPVSLLIWTTTPWSLVANKAICVSETSEYIIVSRQGDTKRFMVAKELMDKSKELQEVLGGKDGLQVHATLKGSDLIGLSYTSPLFSQSESFPVLAAAHVTMDAGTGLVHTAPAHGPDDYQVGVAHELDLSCPVDQHGVYSRSECVPEALQGLFAMKEGSEKVLSLLGEHLIDQRPFVHSYPCDWRTKKPVFLRACPQWFLQTSEAQKEALGVLSDIDVKPEALENGFRSVLEKRPYWCVSRQRVWGAPIPAFYDKETGEPIVTEALVERCCSLLDSHGPDFWWSLSASEILDGTGIDPETSEQGKDILDVWFDSGTTWSSVIEGEEDEPVDLYLEGLDQFSGWFYSSLLTRMALHGKSPYKRLFVHGFTLDEHGKKMSKSIGNVTHPKQITRGESSSSPVQEPKKKKAKTRGSKVYGVDTMRMWVAAHGSQASNINVKMSIMDQTKEDADRLRNALKFAIGNIGTMKSTKDLLPVADLLPLDQYALHLGSEYLRDVSSFYEAMEYNKVCLRIQAHLSHDLSSFYYHLIKDRLYCDTEQNQSRRSGVTALFYISRYLRASTAPILPLLSQEVSEAAPILGDAYETPASELLPDLLSVQESLPSLKLILCDLRGAVKESVGGTDNLKNYELFVIPRSKVGSRALELFGHRDLSESLQVPVALKGSEFPPERSSKALNLGSDLSYSLRETKLQTCQRCRLKILDSESGKDICYRCDQIVNPS